MNARLAVEAITAAAWLAALTSVPAAVAQPASGEWTIPGGGGTELHGTFLRANGTTTSEPVLILAGSGPTDRDGNNTMGVTAAPYRMMAQELATVGISSLRIDKRGIGASAAALGREDDVTVITYAEDARSWVERLRSSTGARCVWIMGHSEGALIALLAAQENRSVCGLILVSGMGRRAGDVLREQLGASPEAAALLAEALPVISELEAGRTVDTARMSPALRTLFRASVQRYWISLLSFDPVDLVRRYDGPVLVVHGTTDLQTSVTDARRLAEARPGVQLALLEGMNHVLKSAPADRVQNAAAYADANRPLAAGLIERIMNFIRRSPAR